MAVHALQFPELQLLSNLVERRPECFASGDREIRSISLNATKFLFDLSTQSETVSTPHIVDLLRSLDSSAPETRSQSSGKRKRTPVHPPLATFEKTPLTSLIVDGMSDGQVWAQLDLRAKHICDTLELILDGGPDDDMGKEDEVGEDSDGSEDNMDEERFNRALEAMASGEDFDFDTLHEMEMLESGSGGDTSSEDSSDESSEDESVPGGDGHREDLGEHVTDLRDPSSEESEEDILVSSPISPRRKKTLLGRHLELDDGFFNLASFNAETEQAEATSSSLGRLGSKEDVDDEDDDTESVDLFAPIRDEQDFNEEGEESGEAMYKDFFAPPPKLAGIKTKINGKIDSLKAAGQVRFHEEVRVKKIKGKRRHLPLYALDSEEGDGYDEGKNVQFPAIDSISSGDEDNHNGGEFKRETIERLKDDLFADEDDSSPQNVSTHEKRMAELREQISEIESENVRSKDWVLMGEADSRARPQNSLLEEDLEFERSMKATPVVTEETVLALEDRIKARILEGRFDDVLRIRPVDDKPFLPSRFFELKDTKSEQSLGQIYESEYIASLAGETGEGRDGRLKKEHDEVQNLWESLCRKLDALCNAHFVPKQPKATISTVINASVATLESAIPTTKSVSAMLAPEEVFSPAVIVARAQNELTPTQKRTLHNKQRRERKKSQDVLEKTVDNYAKVRGIGGIKRQKKAALESVIKRGKGVTVVGQAQKGRKKWQPVAKP